MTRSDISFPERMSRRPRRTAVVVACGALAVAAIGAALGGTVPGVPLRDGPLDGGAAQLIVLRLRESEKAGVLWGTLQLQNPSDRAITLDSVTLSHNPHGVEQQTEPRSPPPWSARPPVPAIR